MPFHLISGQNHQEITDLVDRLPSLKIPETSTHLAAIIDHIQNDIPDKRRISTGRYSIIKALGEELCPRLGNPLGFAAALFENPGDAFVRSLGLQILSLWAVDQEGFEQVRPYFESGAGEEDWIVRECASGLARKLIKAFPQTVRAWYLELVKSPDPNLRRYVSESLRPVVENRWFQQEPEYALGVIQHLYKESAPYPRTSVGNNLSDWMRVDQVTTWPIVTELAKNGDINSHWIAYRACRNLVKKEPVLVMKTLGVTEYKYKNRQFNLADIK